MVQEDKFNVLTGSPEFRYMLLDRLRQDCLYYLGNGNRNQTKLWTGNPKEQIKLMKDLYNSFENKPQWISIEEINDLENKMLNDDIQEKLNVIDSDPELGTVYSPDTFEEFKHIIENNKLKSYDDQISFYLLYDKEFPYGYEFTIQLKDDDFYKVVGHVINKDSINIDVSDVDKYRDVDNFKGNQSVIDFIEDLIDTDGLDYYDVSKGLEIIHNYLNKQKSNEANESIDLINKLKAINNKINEDMYEPIKVLVDTDYGISATLLRNTINNENKFIIVDQDGDVICYGNSEEATIDAYINYMIKDEFESDAIFDIMSREDNVKDQRIKLAFKKFMKDNNDLYEEKLDKSNEGINLLNKLKAINNFLK